MSLSFLADRPGDDPLKPEFTSNVLLKKAALRLKRKYVSAGTSEYS
jgi:hypothetical protein